MRIREFRQLSRRRRVLPLGLKKCIRPGMFLPAHEYPCTPPPPKPDASPAAYKPGKMSSPAAKTRPARSVRSRQSLASEDIQFDGDQRTCFGIEDLVRFRGSDQLIAQVVSHWRIAAIWRSLPNGLAS